MSRKPDGTQRSGRGTAPSAAGGFGGADTALTRLARPFVPKPFRSTGGMSTSADTMASIGMGRHNVEEDLPDDQINVGSIVSRKTSDRRYLPRRLGNMKMYLHTTPLNETLALNAEEIVKRCKLFEIALSDFSDFGKDLMSGVKGFVQDLDPSGETSVGSVAVSAIPVVGDAFSGYRAYKNFGDIKEDVESLEEMLKGLSGDADLFDSPEENNEKMISGEIDLVARTASDREIIKQTVNRIAVLCIEFVVNSFSAIPFELIGFGIADTGIDVASSAVKGIGSSLDPEGEEAAKKFYRAALKMGGTIPSAIQKVESSNIPGKDKILGLLKEINQVSNLIGNLSLIYMKLSSIEQESTSGEDESLPLAEKRQRRKKRANEISVAANVAGYTGPMTSPKNPRDFYNTMAKAAGSEYLIDPVKTIKPKP